MRNAEQPSAEEIQALIDGELSPDDAARVRSVLACSPDAMIELDECMQMAALAFVLRTEARELESALQIERGRSPVGASSVIPILRPMRRPKTLMAMVASLAMAAAAAVFVLHHHSSGPGDEPVVAAADPASAFTAALSPRRPMAPRLSWAAADRYRPYDTARAGGTGERPAETLSFELLGRVEKLGDARAITAAQVLRGDTTQARNQLVLAKPSPDADSDRAAISLVDGKPEDALLAASAAIESHPGHVQATWNRALALERLGMPLTAADAFEAVAARREPGWSQEAAERATALRAQFQRRKSAWEAANAAGAQLVAGGPPPRPISTVGVMGRARAGSIVEDGNVAAYPSLMRRYLYEAVRTADSAARVKALRPLAATLDARFGGSHLTDYIDRIAKSDFRRRAPLAARYAALARREMKDPAAVQDLLRDLRAARQKDILLGALVHAGNNPDRPEEAELDEYLALAKGTGDPWFALEAADHRAWFVLLRDEVLRAQTLLGAAEKLCNGAEAIDYLCGDVFRLATHAFQDMHRPDAARRTLDRALDIARSAGNVAQETQLLWYAHWIAALRGETSSTLMPVSWAYLDEFTRQSDDCGDARDAREWKAMELINRNRIDDARKLMFGDSAECEAPFSTGRAFVLAHLLSESGDDAAVQALRHNIAALRSSKVAPGERAFLDHTEGRLLVTRMPGEGRALLRRAIAEAADLPAEDSNAAKARAYSYSVLIEQAAVRDAPSEVFGLLAEEIGEVAPERCALGASQEASPVFVARAADGKETLFRAPRAPGEPAGQRGVPASMQASFVGCQSVDVFARQPYYGRPDLLPRDVAWQFRTRGSEHELPPRQGRQVVVANIAPPPGLDLAPLRALEAAPGATLIEGATATPERVIAAAADASFLEIHAHGLPGGADSDTSVLVLASDARGRYALGGADIRRARLRGSPVVVLAACHASAVGETFHSTWGLADAFVAAGARAVIASPDPIQDAGAPVFFAALRKRIAAGEPPAQALRAERLTRTDSMERSWIRSTGRLPLRRERRPEREGAMGNGNGSNGFEVVVRPQAGTPPGKDPKATDPKDTKRGTPPGKNPRLICLADTVAMSTKQLNDDLYRYLDATEDGGGCCGGTTAGRLLRNLKASTSDLADDLEALGKLLADEEQLAIMAAKLAAVAPPGKPAAKSVSAAMPATALTTASTEQAQNPG